MRDRYEHFIVNLTDEVKDEAVSVFAKGNIKHAVVVSIHGPIAGLRGEVANRARQKGE